MSANLALAQDAPRTLSLATELPRVTLYHPDDMPRLYALICDGNCVEPVYRDGQTLLFSKDEPWRAGDFVAIYRTPESVPLGENPILLKRLVSAPPPSFFMQAIRTQGPFARPTGTVRSKVIARMLNPERSIILNCEDVLGIHKCIGPIEGYGATH